MIQEEEFTMKVIKDSSTGFFSNQRLLFIKAGIIAYYSKIPKKYVGNVRSLQLSGQFPKFTISAADLQNVECKENLLMLYFKKSKLVDREDMRRMVEGQESLRMKPPLNEDIEKWVFRCDNLEQAAYFYKQIQIHRIGEHKPQIANAIDGYRSAQKSHRQLSMLPTRDKLTPTTRMSQIPKSAMYTTQRSNNEASKDNREGSKGKSPLKQMSRSPSKKQIEDIIMKSPEKKAFLKKSPNRSIEKRNESPKDIKWTKNRKEGESVFAKTIIQINEQRQERDIEESKKKNQIEMKEMQIKENERKKQLRENQEIKKKELIQQQQIMKKRELDSNRQRLMKQQRKIEQIQRAREEAQRKEEAQKKEKQMKDKQMKEKQLREKQMREKQRKEIQRKEIERKEIEMQKIELNCSSPPSSPPSAVTLKPSAYRTSLPLQLVMDMIQEQASERNSQQKQGDPLEVQLGPKDVNELLSVDIQKKYRIDNQLVDLIRVASYTRTLDEIENIFKIPQQILTSLDISPPHRITFSKEGKAQFVEAQFVEAEEQEDIIATFEECKKKDSLSLISQQNKRIQHNKNETESKNMSNHPQKEKEEDITRMRELKKERELAYSRVSLVYSRMNQLQVDVRRVKSIYDYHPIQMDSTVDLRGMVNYRGSIPSSVTEQLGRLEMERVACTPLIEYIMRLIDEMPCCNKLIQIGFQDYTIWMWCVGQHHSAYSALLHLRRVVRRVSGLVGLRLEMGQVLYMEYKHYKCLCKKESDSLPLQSYKCLHFLQNNLNQFRKAFPHYQVRATRVSLNHYQLTCVMDSNQCSQGPNQCSQEPNQCSPSQEPINAIPKHIRDYCQATIKTINRVDQQSTLRLVNQIQAQHNNIGVYALSRILHFKMEPGSLVFEPVVQFMNVSLMQPLSEKAMRGDEADVKECLHCLLLYLQKMHPYECNENVVQVCLQIGQASWLQEGTAAEMLLLRVLELTSQFTLSRYEAYILLIKLYLVRLSQQQQQQQQEQESLLTNKLMDIYQNCGLYLGRMFKSEMNIYSLGLIKLGAVLKSDIEREEIYQRYITEITQQIGNIQSGIDGLNAIHQLLDMLIEFKISLSYTYLTAGKTYLAYLNTKQLMGTLSRGVSSHYIDCVVLIGKAWLHLQTNYLNQEGIVTQHDRTQLQPSDTAYVQTKIYHLVDILIKRRDISKIREVFKLAIKISEKCERSKEKKIRLYGKLKEGGKSVPALAQYLGQLLEEEKAQLRIGLASNTTRWKMMGNIFST